MSSVRTKGLAVVAAAWIVGASCAPDGRTDAHDHDGHDGHDGDAAHAHGTSATIVTTRWTGRTELFMEHPPLVAGESARAAVHLTRLSDFSPVAESEVVVELASPSGPRFRFDGTLSSPGIFRVSLEPAIAGVYRMTVRLRAPGLDDLHEVGEVRVYSDAEAAKDAATPELEGITFLKEQQWTFGFGTSEVSVRSLRGGFEVPAEVRSRPGGELWITAPVAGRIDPSVEVPDHGGRVESGELLARITPRSTALLDAGALRASLVEATEERELAVRELARVERLAGARAIPQRRVDEARAALAAAEARADAARQRLERLEALNRSGTSNPEAGAFSVRAPFTGVVSQIRFSPGATVDDGEPLVRLVDTDRIHIVCAVPERRVRSLDGIGGGELLAPGSSPVALPSPVSRGRIVDPVSRTAEVRFALDDAPAGLVVGQSATVRLFEGEEASAPTVPEAAIVDDGGVRVVFVQIAGETFERRVVELGARSGGYVHVSSGVAPGERVVDEGAYLVRLAALSTQIPAHGHVH